jgi:hypothetical protein
LCGGRTKSDKARRRNYHNRQDTFQQLTPIGRIVLSLEEADNQWRSRNDAERIGRKPDLPNGQGRCR